MNVAVTTTYPAEHPTTVRAPGAEAAGRPRRVGLRWLPALALHGLVAWLYVWFATAGTYGFAHRESDDYYDLLANAFLAGQLHLLIEPAPELLALPDPYDPARNGRYRLRDAALYDGKYYLYWGPVPGLVHAAWKAVAGRPLGDGPACLLFGLAGCLLFWLLARELRDRLAPAAPDALVWLVYACYALGGVSLYLQVRADVYKEAILAGICFTLAGLYFWVRALLPRDGGVAGATLALAGLLFGLGFGSRMTMIAYAAGAGLVLAWQARRALRRPADALPLLWFGLPAGAVLAMLLVYNYVRFDSFAEFGVRYQLVSVSNGQQVLSGGMHSAFIPFNLAAYWTHLPEMLPWFPLLVFVNPPLTLVEVGSFIWKRDTFSVAAPLLAPLIALAPIGVALAVTRRRSSTAGPIVAGLAIGLVLNLALLHLFVSANMRYQHDFVSIALLLGALALWWLWPSPTRPARRVARAALAGALLAVSLATSLGYATNHLGRVRPEAYLYLAYRFDSVMAALPRTVAPTTWTETYADQAGRRLLGAFAPADAALTVFERPGGRLTELSVWSLLPADTTLAITADGRTVYEGRLRPGQQRLRLSRAVTIGPSGTAALELRFPESTPRPAGPFWPVAVTASD